MKKSELFFNVLRLPVDFFMLLVAGVSTYFLRTEILSAFRPVLFEFTLPFAKYLYLVLFVSLIFVASYAVSGLYSLKIRRGLFDEFLKITVASSAGIMMIIIYIFLRQELFDSRFLVLGGWFFAVVFVFIGRLLVSLLQKYFVAKRNFGVHNVVVIGNDELATAVIDKINGDPSYGYRLLKHMPLLDIGIIKKAKTSGLMSGEGPARSPRGTRAFAERDPREAGFRKPGLGNRVSVDEVMLTNSSYPEVKVLKLVDFCHENHIVFKYVPNMYKTLTANFDIDVVGGLPLIELKRTRLDGWGKVIKRTLDIFASVLGIVILIPLYFAVAIAVKIDSRGPVLVRLRRISRNREFGLLKFRSMVENAEELKASLTVFNERKDGPLFKMKDDPRITKIGRFIRKYRIDELPQFWNVLKGDMSLVGPRPHQPDEISRYQKHHKKVLAIKAGATGLAQVGGSSDLPFEQEVALDTFYVENWSSWLDIRIILKTILKVFTDKSAV